MLLYYQYTCTLCLPVLVVVADVHFLLVSIINIIDSNIIIKNSNIAAVGIAVDNIIVVGDSVVALVDSVLVIEVLMVAVIFF